jgi:hypothetical protein
LRACEEKRKTLIDDHSVVIVEVFVLEQNAEQVGTAFVP